MIPNNHYPDRLKEHFSPLIEAHGDSFRGVDWGSRESQRLRFSILSEAINNTLTQPFNFGGTILDVGCGMGHFVDYLKEHSFNGKYKGIDILPDMLDKAKSRHPDQDFECFNIFESQSLPGTFDYVVASGIFFCGDEPSMSEAISILFKQTNRVLVFNSLSAWSAEKDNNEFYACPIKTLELCHKYTPWLTLRHDYMPNDFTIAMYKEKNS